MPPAQDLCRDCAEDLHLVLVDVPVLVLDLQLALTRQTRFVEHGLTVGPEGLAFRCYTVNVKNDQDEALLGFLESDTFRAGLRLSNRRSSGGCQAQLIQWRPVIGGACRVAAMGRLPE